MRQVSRIACTRGLALALVVYGVAANSPPLAAEAGECAGLLDKAPSGAEITSATLQQGSGAFAASGKIPAPAGVPND
jgi:hypothetical protein